MKYNQLGATGIFVTDLALGTMTFGETNGRGADEETSIRMIHHYLDNGGNHIDCANAYAGGVSEQITGKALQGKRDDVILATKVNFPTKKGVNNFGLSRKTILSEVHACLKRLQTDYIDLLYMHCWDRVTPIEESLRTFQDLVTQGKVRYIGVSNFKAWQLMKALGLSEKHQWVKFVAAQYQYSLLNREIEYEYTDLCASEGLGIIPWGPLGGGFLSGKYRREQRPQDFSDGRIGGMPEHSEESWDNRNVQRNWDILEVLGQIADARNTSYASIALAWLRAKSGVASTLMGVRTMDQLEDNLKAATIDLSAEEVQQLDEVSTPRPMYPYGFIENYGRKFP
ncbi:MAG: aldo/keto reductase [Bacteroidota bacterium]